MLPVGGGLAVVAATRRRELARMAALLRWRLADVQVRALTEATIEAVAKALFLRLNPGDEWEDASVETQETFRCDADAAIVAAFGGRS